MKVFAISGSECELHYEISAVEDLISNLALGLKPSGTFPTSPLLRDEESMQRDFREYVANSSALFLLVGQGRPNSNIPHGIVRVEHQYMTYFYQKALEYKIPIGVFVYEGLELKENARRGGETELIESFRQKLRDEQKCYEFASKQELVRHSIDFIYSTINKTKYEFDVALSFSGHDREIARKIAIGLKKRGIKVFYDQFFSHYLWGKDLAKYLGEIYEHRARYCIVLSSRHYAFGSWTRHERQHAQARQLREPDEYILQLRLDDTPIPGIPKTIAYVHFENVDSTIELILAKLLLSR